MERRWTCLTVDVVGVAQHSNPVDDPNHDLQQEVCVFQGKIEDFNHDYGAGGTVDGFGPALSSFLLRGFPGNAVLTSAQLFTVPAELSSQGFRYGETFFGVKKTFVASLEAQRDPDRVATSIDARGFDKISYKIGLQSDGKVASGESRFAQVGIELQIGDGGIVSDDNPRPTGSSWSQFKRVDVSSLPVYPKTSPEESSSADFETFTVSLVTRIEGSDAGFVRTLAARGNSDHTNLESLLGNITAVKLTVFSNGEETRPAKPITLGVAGIGFQ